MVSWSVSRCRSRKRYEISDPIVSKFTTKVVSCIPVKPDTADKHSEYEVILEDTILFPEGGGQPYDMGTINGIQVLQVKRKGNQALHFVQTPFEVDCDAQILIDWSRRLDHMQQHTGQHLITAIAEDMFNFCTTSWNLGKDISFIEMNTPSIKAEEMDKLEKELNKKIKLNIPVTVSLYEKNSPELKKVHTRLEMPEDHNGPVRVVSIQGIDNNTCCGTHLKNLGELQAIKLLYAEKGKKNKTNLYFVAGEQLLKYMGRCIAKDRAVNRILGCNPDNQVTFVEKLQKSLKLANKNALNALRDIAVLEAKMFKQLEPRPPYFSLHRKDAEPEFMTIFANEVKDDNVLLFLTVGDDKNGGQMLLVGPMELVNKFGPLVCNILDGKGAVKNGKFQAKLTKLSKWSEADDLLKKNFAF